MYPLLDLILIDLYECDHGKLIDKALIKKGLLKAAELMGAEVKGYSFNTFKPWGISGIITIAESHMAIHTWPEHNFAAVTFETCGSRMNHTRAFEYLVQLFDAKNPKITQMKRGFIDPPEEAIYYNQS